ncbi:hypothetical protein Tco_0822433 [Tanacetum coccineum]|uniref:Uncharacterized protein n=1 Tax=Tanacetum coccineum TaxID=301880 RepID=A0ABQ5AGW5_9ASTR
MNLWVCCGEDSIIPCAQGFGPERDKTCNFPESDHSGIFFHGAQDEFYFTLIFCICRKHRFLYHFPVRSESDVDRRFWNTVFNVHHWVQKRFDQGMCYLFFSYTTTAFPCLLLSRQFGSFSDTGIPRSVTTPPKGARPCGKKCFKLIYLRPFKDQDHYLLHEDVDSFELITYVNKCKEGFPFTYNFVEAYAWKFSLSERSWLWIGLTVLWLWSFLVSTLWVADCMLATFDRSRTSMDVVIACQVVYYHLGKPSIRGVEEMELTYSSLVSSTAFLSDDSPQHLQNWVSGCHSYSQKFFPMSSTGRVAGTFAEAGMLGRSCITHDCPLII